MAHILYTREIIIGVQKKAFNRKTNFLSLFIQLFWLPIFILACVPVVISLVCIKPILSYAKYKPCSVFQSPSEMLSHKYAMQFLSVNWSSNPEFQFNFPEIVLPTEQSLSLLPQKRPALSPVNLLNKKQPYKGPLCLCCCQTSSPFRSLQSTELFCQSSLHAPDLRILLKEGFPL